MILFGHHYLAVIHCQLYLQDQLHRQKFTSYLYTSVSVDLILPMHSPYDVHPLCMFKDLHSLILSFGAFFVCTKCTYVPTHYLTLPLSFKNLHCYIENNSPTHTLFSVLKIHTSSLFPPHVNNSTQNEDSHDFCNTNNLGKSLLSLHLPNNNKTHNNLIACWTLV